MSRWAVYCLCHPETREVYYVGCTVNLASRLCHHYMDTGVWHKPLASIEHTPSYWRGMKKALERKQALIARHRMGLELVVPMVMMRFDEEEDASIFEMKMVDEHKPVCNSGVHKYKRKRRPSVVPDWWLDAKPYTKKA